MARAIGFEIKKSVEWKVEQQKQVSNLKSDVQMDANDLV